jgi:PAS domain S-box-containing protein
MMERENVHSMDVYRVLYVDDEPQLLELGKIFLERGGPFIVDTLSSAPDALAQLTKKKYDAIVADYQMPGMDGIEFLKKVRSSKNPVPFILFTGRGREEVVIQALNEGADFYLQKGGDPTPQFMELSHKIQRAIFQKKAEIDVVLRESYLTAIIENQPGLVWLKDRESRFLATNEAFARSCGKQSSADVLGRTDLDVWPRELAEKYREDDARVIREKQPLHIEEMISDHDEKKWFETFKMPIMDAAGEVIGTTGFARDITDRRRVETALRQSEDELKKENRKLTSIHELEREFAGLPSLTRVENLAAKKLSVLSGAVVTVFSIYSPAEQVLRTAAIEFAPGILESLPGSWEKVTGWLGMKPDEVTIPVSREGYQDFRRSIIGKKNTLTEISNGKIPPLVSASIQKLSGIDRFIHIAHIIDGELYGTSVIGLRPGQPDPSEELLESFAHMVAVSLRRQQAEDALRESEGKFRAVVDQSIDGIIIVDFSGNLLFANNSAAQLTGYDLDMVGKLNVLTLVSPEFRLQAMSDFALVAAGTDGYPKEYKILGAEKKELWIECVGKKISFAGSPAMMLSIRDLSGRQRAEEASRSREEFFREITENLVYVFYVHDRASNSFVYVSPAFEKVWMRSRQTLYDNPYSYLEAVHPDDRPHLEECIRRELEDGIYVDTEYRIIRPDGTVRWIHSRNFPVTGKDGTVYRVAGTAEDITDLKNSRIALQESEEKFRSLVEYALESISIIDFSGKGLFTNRATAQLLELDADTPLAGRSVMEFLSPESQADAMKDFDRVAGGEDAYLTQYSVTTAKGNTLYLECIGKVISYEGKTAILLSLRDITGRKKAEDALRSANRQLTLLTGITRHDILNKISVILGFLKIARMKTGDPALVDYLKKIDAATAAIKSQIEFTRVYQDLGTHEPQWLALDTVMPRSHVPTTITLNADGKDIQVFADPMLERVFFNLLDNSIQHGQRVSRIRVSSQRAGDDLVVVWEDDGVGIPGDEKEKIFERGFGKNTGLGMFLAREILSLTGITITENGEPGEGARFEIVVPKGAWRVSDKK